jgi:hypothetical protein
MVESIIFTSSSYTPQSDKEAPALNIFIGKSYLLLLYFYPSINGPAYMASESLFKPMVDFGGCSWCYRKGTEKLIFFEFLNFS